MLAMNCFIHPSVLMRKSSLETVGGYDESPACRHVEDFDLWLKLGKVGKMANLPIYGIRYTLSATQISAKHKLEQFRKSVSLINKYRHDYPHAGRAILRAYVRLVAYGYLNAGWLSKLTSRKA